MLKFALFCWFPVCLHLLSNIVSSLASDDFEQRETFPVNYGQSFTAALPVDSSNVKRDSVIMSSDLKAADHYAGESDSNSFSLHDSKNKFDAGKTGNKISKLDSALKHSAGFKDGAGYTKRHYDSHDNYGNKVYNDDSGSKYGGGEFRGKFGGSQNHHGSKYGGHSGGANGKTSHHKNGHSFEDSSLHDGGGMKKETYSDQGTGKYGSSYDFVDGYSSGNSGHTSKSDGYNVRSGHDDNGGESFNSRNMYHDDYSHLLGDFGEDSYSQDEHQDGQEGVHQSQKKTEHYDKDQDRDRGGYIDGKGHSEFKDQNKYHKDGRQYGNFGGHSKDDSYHGDVYNQKEHDSNHGAHYKQDKYGGKQQSTKHGLNPAVEYKGYRTPKRYTNLQQNQGSGSSNQEKVSDPQTPGVSTSTRLGVSERNNEAYHPLQYKTGDSILTNGGHNKDGKIKKQYHQSDMNKVQVEVVSTGDKVSRNFINPHPGIYVLNSLNEATPYMTQASPHERDNVLHVSPDYHSTHKNNPAVITNSFPAMGIIQDAATSVREGRGNPVNNKSLKNLSFVHSDAGYPDSGSITNRMGVGNRGAEPSTNYAQVITTPEGYYFVANENYVHFKIF